MIYGKQYHPPKPEPLVKQLDKPPTEDKLRALVKGGPDYFDMVEDWIEKHSLPYTLEIAPDGLTAELKPTLTRGEQYLSKFITVNEDTITMKNDARKMSRTQHSVLITGETGTGKEMIANSMIDDRKGNIRAVNCAGFPETLIESELFGYEKGSFTGADVAGRKGMMEAANDGILFLDEIGELPMSMQAKLLRALQDRMIRPIGAKEERPITCKFVCATNKNLKDMVKNGLFRQDLFARISTLEIDILPLRDRKEDILPITESLKDGNKLIEKYGTELVNGSLDISNNVRSLEQHVIRYSVLGRVTIK